jgi:hypothetical protein
MYNNINEAARAHLATLINDEVTYDICTVVKGSGNYKTAVDVGEVVSTEVNANGSWGHQLIKVKKGETYYVEGTGGGNPRLWAFTDEHYRLLSKSAQNVVTSEPVELTPTQDGYLFINVTTAASAAYSIRKLVTDTEYSSQVADTLKQLSDIYEGLLAADARAALPIVQNYNSIPDVLFRCFEASYAAYKATAEALETATTVETTPTT